MSQAVVEVLRGLHEGTHYKVRGREELSEEWLPFRGLREGSTSPILFNVYQAEAMKSVEEETREDGEERASVRIDVGLGSRERIPRDRPQTNVD